MSKPPRKSSSSVPSKSEIRKTLLEFATSRSAGATFCPSEVARHLSTDWRPLMDKIRQVAATLIADGKLHCTQKGQVADPLTARGPIRLARADKPRD